MSRHAMPGGSREMPGFDIGHVLTGDMPGNGHGWTGEQARALGLAVQIMEAVLWDEAVMI